MPASITSKVSFLTFTQMWESFSFFGMRALLVLFLVSEGAFTPQDAFILYTLYIALVKICAGAGGYVVDHFLEYKKGVIIGGFFIMAGHIALAFFNLTGLFFLGLASIICGSSLFRVSLQSLLGSLYAKEDPERENGFTKLYVSMNLGGLLAAILCGFVAQIYGWSAGFGLAAFGMFMSLVVFMYKMHLLDHITESKKNGEFVVSILCVVSTLLIAYLLSFFNVIHHAALPVAACALGYIFFTLRKKMNSQMILGLAGAFALLIAFFTAEELWGSLLMVFSEDHIARTLFGYEIPSAAIAATNPLTIILLGPLMAKRDLPLFSKLALAFLFLGCAFMTLYATAKLDHPSFLYLVGGLMAVAIGELLIAPTVLSLASHSAPQGSTGLVMGATTLAFSIGSLLSGEVAKIPANPETTFLGIGVAAFVIFLLLFAKAMVYNKQQQRPQE